MGSGCGSVGRMVESDTRGHRFKSRHYTFYKVHLFAVSFIEKTKIKKKRLKMAKVYEIGDWHCQF